MKIFLKTSRGEGMTRVEFLIAICIALIVVYLVVRYQGGGEVFQISWRKTRVKEIETKTLLDARPQPISPIAPPSAVENSSNIQFNVVVTNPTKQETNGTVVIQNAGIRLVDHRQQKVLFPTNAVTNAGRFLRTRPRAGVRIAFP